jgi:transglutaminase superfamily protein
MSWSFWKTSALNICWPRPDRRASFEHFAEVRSLDDWLLVLRALVLATSVPLLMRLPLPRVARVLEPRRAPHRGDAEHVLALVNLALALARPIVRPTCLHHGITRYYFLRRAGANVQLNFGIGRVENGPFAGHCWLARHGEPFAEPRDPRPVFTTVYVVGAEC